MGPPRSGVGRYGAVRLRQDHLVELPEREIKTGQRTDLPQQGSAVQTLAEEDLLRPATGYILSRSDVAANVGVHCQTTVT